MNEFEQLRDHPVFICGHPKSGTTLLMALLDSHPQLVVYPAETIFFRGLLPRVKNSDYSEKLSLGQRFLLHYFDSMPVSSAEGSHAGDSVAYNTYIQYAESCRIMESLLPPENFRHDGDLLSAAILAFGKVYQKINPQSRYWVEKTPYNEYFAEQIYRWWPDARCIHVVRDPRDNYATYRRKHPNLSAERFSRSWSTSLKAGLQSQKRYGIERYWILRYEDLTQEPNRIIGEMTRFLGIEDNEILRTPTKNGVFWQGNSMFNERFSGISSRPLGRWKRELNPNDVAVIEIACKFGMKRLGYLPHSGFSIRAFGRLLVFYALMTMRLPSDLLQTVRRHYGVMPQ